MSKTPAWLKLRKKTEPEYQVEPPIWMGNHSNGEYYHPQTKREAQMRKEILRRADDQARYLGMDRREFMASSMGMATTLSVINMMGCGSTSDDDTGKTAPTGSAPYVVPKEATCEPADYLEQEYFIMDVQTHAFDDGEWREKNTAYPIFARLIASPTCTEPEKLDCFNQNHYAESMFIDSDTTVAVITSWPAATCFPERELLQNSSRACGLPLDNAAMRDLREWVNTRAMSQRVINQVQVMPNDIIERQIEGMYAAMEDEKWRAGSWKAYPAWRSDTYTSPEGFAEGYFMTDPVGVAFIEAGLKLGVPNFAIHKGLPIPGFDVEHNKPTDIGPIAKMFPEANFVIYHSAINAGRGGSVLDSLAPPPTEDVPYAPTGEVFGVNMLIRSLIDEGLITEDGDGNVTRNGPLNVYAEMGSSWRQCMGDPNMAQHYMGKLLKYLGPDNIVWGTDCILGGSPQSQILAFKGFEISEEYQGLYGYPAITTEMKAKIFGLNAARLYRVDPDITRCKVEQSDLAIMKRELDTGLGKNRWVVKPPLGPRTRREFMALARINKAKGMPG